MYLVPNSEQCVSDTRAVICKLDPKPPPQAVCFKDTAKNSEAWKEYNLPDSHGKIFSQVRTTRPTSHTAVELKGPKSGAAPIEEWQPLMGSLLKGLKWGWNWISGQNCFAPLRFSVFSTTKQGWLLKQLPLWLSLKLLGKLSDKSPDSHGFSPPEMTQVLPLLCCQLHKEAERQVPNTYNFLPPLLPCCFPTWNLNKQTHNWQSRESSPHLGSLCCFLPCLLVWKDCDSPSVQRFLFPNSVRSLHNTAFNH